MQINRLESTSCSICLRKKKWNGSSICGRARDRPKLVEICSTHWFVPTAHLPFTLLTITTTTITTITITITTYLIQQLLSRQVQCALYLSSQSLLFTIGDYVNGDALLCECRLTAEPQSPVCEHNIQLLAKVDCHGAAVGIFFDRIIKRLGDKQEQQTIVNEVRKSGLTTGLMTSSS